MTTPMERAVAIVGMAATFPGAADLAAYWRNVCDGVDAIGDVPSTRWDRVFYDPTSEGRADRFYCKRGGFLAEPIEFDAAAFGIMPIAAQAAEPEQLIALQAAAAALKDAGPQPPRATQTTGVIIGRGGYLTPGIARLSQQIHTAEQLSLALRGLFPDMSTGEIVAIREAFQQRAGETRADAAIGLVPNLTASRIANRLDLRGPAYTVDAACASSLIAVDHGCSELHRGRCDLVIAGGVHLCQDVTFWSVFSQLGALSRNQQIRPFDRRADGLLIGEGVGIVVLKRLVDAERDGDRIYATIRGVGIASDGRGGGLMKPSVDGQLQALRSGWKEAGLDPTSVGYVEAHGTATPVGDAAELETLGRFFGERGDAGLGSVKSMIGHTMPAAGIAGLIKAALAVHHGVLPPTLHCEQPHQDLARTRFRLVTEREPWATTAPRRAGVNAFGFGGINAHVVLEQHGHGRRTRNLAAGPPTTPKEERVLLLAAETDRELLAMLDDEGARRPVGPADTCRLAVFDPTRKRLAVARKIIERGKPWRGRQQIWFTPQGVATTGARVAFVFPGIEASFEPRVDDIAAHFGWSIPEATGATALERHGTHLVAVSRLLDRALRRLGVRPDVIAGHSVGEWTGMITSEMIPAEQVDSFMATLAPGQLAALDVSFVAVGCGADQAGQLIAELSDVCVSHDNCPHQAIICGPHAAIEQAMTLLRGAKVLCQLLPFRSGFHTPLYAEALACHQDNFARIPLQAPSVPLWSATTCAPYPADPDQTRRLLGEHLVQPVRFRQLIEALHTSGVGIFVSVGPSATLGGFIQDTLRGEPHLAIAANTPKRSGLAQLARVAAALYVEGVAVGFEALPITVETNAKAARRTIVLELGVPLVELDALGASRPALRQTTVERANDPVVAEFQVTFDEMVAAHEQVLEAWTKSPNVGPSQRTITRTLSLETQPQLIDHCFYRQPADAAVEDRFPVVPMTMNLELMIEAARQLVPTKVAVALENITAYRWLAVAPAAQIEITSRFDGVDRVNVRVGDYASGTVVLGDDYVELPPQPRLPLANERPPRITAAQLYTDRWMFHGPAYQGVARIDTIADNGICGQLIAVDALGGLLDNAGQLFGFWVMNRVETDRLAFPVRIARIEFGAPPPRNRASVDCVVRINEFSDVLVHADMELRCGGKVWARITDWVDRRFDTDDVVWPMLRFPENNMLSRRDDMGNYVAVERWKGAASRELMARRYLDAAERAKLDAMGLRGQRGWLLGRIAIKDAVRDWLWRRGHGDLFPIEIGVGNDASGRPYVRAPGDAELCVSVAHKAEIAVARVSLGRPVGVDIERIESRTDGFADIAFSPAERSLRSDEDRDEWLTRVWAAKEAAAKMLGTGLQGNPRRFEVKEVAGERLLVNDVWVETRRRGDYIVAWSEQ